MRTAFQTAIASFTLAVSVPAAAETLPFTGSVTGSSNFIGADAACAPLPFRTAIDPSSTIGHSSLGDFTFSTSTCISLGGVISTGTFIIDFGEDLFKGTFDGGSTPTDIAMVSNTAWIFTILEGTGRFEGASGTFDGTGIADARSRPTQVAINFVGNVSAPAVPEPASWMMLILGFGAIGLVARRRGRAGSWHLAPGI